MPLPPFTVASRWRLACARALAWGLWLGAWLALGALGRWASPLAAGGAWPLALCLLGVGGGMSALSMLPLSARHLRGALPLLGLTAGAAWFAVPRAGGPWALALAALAWGLLLVAASQAVRLLRQGQGPVPAPVLPAAVGAWAAWAVAGDSPAQMGPAGPVALCLAAVALAALLPAAAGALRRCRAGLFDCAWPVPAAAAWRDSAQWPMVAARLSMLPMMAALPWMGEWCAVAFQWSPGVDVALHLGAMLGPAVLLRSAAPAWLLRRPEPLVLALQLAGAGALAWQPGLGTLVGAGLSQALAWSLAWSVPLYRRPMSGACVDPVHGGVLGLGRAAGAAAGVLALGTVLAAQGPWAWMAIQMGLALLALAGALVAVARSHGPGLQEGKG